MSGRTPPAGPQWLRGLPPLAGSALGYDEPLCASLDGFTLHAATRAGAADTAGREALVRYVLRPPIAQKNVELLPDGLVRIALKRAYQDGTVAVEMDPLSLLSRLAASVPPPRHHVVKYGGVLAPASPWRARVAPARPTEPDAGASCEAATAPCQLEGVKTRAGTYRPWAELLRRTFERRTNCSRHRAGERDLPDHTPLSSRSRPGGRAAREAGAVGRRASLLPIGPGPCCLASSALDEPGP